MAKRLFVGGISYSTTNAQLEELFSKIGKVVSCNIITDRFSGQSKGFAFVEMETDELGAEAITKLNGATVDDRQIAVTEARPREERGPGNFDRRNSGSQRGSFSRGRQGGGGRRY